MVATSQIVDYPLQRVTRRWREAQHQFLTGNPHRAIELLNEAVGICEQFALFDCYSCLAVHIDLYRIHRAMGHHHEASEHFQRAVSMGANPSWLRLN